MNKIPILLLSSLLLFASSLTRADNLAIKPFVQGSFEDIKNQRKNRAFVVIFWSESCSYCMKELALFGKLQANYPGVELVTVATDAFLDDAVVNQVLDRSGLDLAQTWVFAEQFPEIIYADINKRWRGELPATHFFDREHQEVRHMGIIDKEELTKWLTEQSGS